MQESNVRIIFGLKLRQLRKENRFSLNALSEKSGLSISYLNEIEKGKKYPKTEKILSLAKALNVPYDQLVSLKLTKNLAPLGNLILSNILNDLPLEIFGLNYNNLVDWMANAPTKVGAFINTILEISRNYDLGKEKFYFAALRSYQELHENYFEDLELKVPAFLAHFNLDGVDIISSDQLRFILKEHYNYEVERFKLEDYPDLGSIRSLYVEGKSPKLLINPNLNDAQLRFVLGREIAFNYLEIQDRPHITILVKVPSFDHVLNNFRASYFTTAFLIPEHKIMKDIQSFIEKSTWDNELFLTRLRHYQISPELFFHRMTNMIPKHFGLKHLFFLRFQNQPSSDQYFITQELHLSQLHTPHGNELFQHYCRRWVTIRTLKELAKPKNKREDIVVDTQISNFINNDKRYFCISIARPMSPTPNMNASVTIGFAMTDAFKKQVRFLNDPNIPNKEVGTTCEQCPIVDCKDRVVNAIILEQKAKNEQVKNALRELRKTHLVEESILE